MKIETKYPQRSDEWLEFRKGKVTGSKLKNIIVKRGNKKKIGFYELMAERIATLDGYEEESPMNRGTLLEDEALGVFEKNTGKKVEHKDSICISDEDKNMILSPDGLIKVSEDKEDEYSEALEIKCLSTANHLRAFFEKEIPSDYEEQAMQYFIINPELKKLHFNFYDPRLKNFKKVESFTIEIERFKVAETIQLYKDYQKQVLKEVDALLESIIF